MMGKFRYCTCIIRLIKAQFFGLIVKGLGGGSYDTLSCSFNSTFVAKKCDVHEQILKSNQPGNSLKMFRTINYYIYMYYKVILIKGEKYTLIRQIKHKFLFHSLVKVVQKIVIWFLVMTANPECSDSRISEILMETWDNLSASEKTTYELKAGAQSLEKGSVLFLMHCLYLKSTPLKILQIL